MYAGPLVILQEPLGDQLRNFVFTFYFGPDITFPERFEDHQ